jgi:predicted ATPase
LSHQHPLSEALAQLAREPVFQRELLRGLSPEDTGNFIESTIGVRAPQRLVNAIHAHTEGNPFFMSEVVRFLRERGELTEEDRAPLAIRIPEGVREVIRQRLNRLSGPCNWTLTIASIIGREFDFRLLNSLRDRITEEQLLQVIDEALETHVIEEATGGIERYQFSHALIQETLARELSTSRRVRLHARIGESLEEFLGADAEAHAAELVHHFTEGITATGPDKLMYYSLRAGERALAAYAPEEALGYFERALAAKVGRFRPAGQDQAADADTAALLFGLGQARAATLPRHRLGEAVDSLIRAFNYYDAAQDVERAVAVAECLFYPPLGQHLTVSQLIRRALELAPPDFHQAGRLLSRYGMVMGLAEGGDYPGAQKALEQALAIAGQWGDSALEMQTLACAARVDRFHLRFHDCLEKSRRAIELARRVDAPYTEVEAHRLAVNTMTYLGDLEGARSHASAMLELAERLGDHYWLVTALTANERQARLTGNLETAQEFSDRGLALSPIDPRLLAPRSLLEYERGNFEQGETYLERLLEAVRVTAPGATSEYATPAIVIPLVARITGTPARFNTAEELAHEILSSPSVTPLVARVARAGLALLAVLRKDAAAREQYNALAPVLRKPSISAAAPGVGLSWPGPAITTPICYL